MIRNYTSVYEFVSGFLSKKGKKKEDWKGDPTKESVGNKTIEEITDKSKIVKMSVFRGAD